jgi:adenylyltransferase/sulfurtransferase
VIGSHGQTKTIFPGESACIRCLIESVPAPGTTETCDTAGVLGPAVNVVASLEAATALKILSGQKKLVEPSLMILDVWDLSFRKMNVGKLRDQADRPACRHGERVWLSGEKGGDVAVLCGRNAVQVRPPEKTTLDLSELAEKLQTSGEVQANKFLLKLNLKDPEYELTIFKDGRAIIKGTEDIGVARGLYARYIGT